MIKFITVWVLTVTFSNGQNSSNANSHAYQLQYATQAICEKQRKNHEGSLKETQCNFQQVPIFVK